MLTGDKYNHSERGIAEDAEVRIYDLCGKLIMEKNFDGMSGEISTKDWSSGFYILQLWRNGEMIAVEKILKE